MTNKEFNLMCALAYEGLDNGQYQFAQDIENTTAYCGINESMKLDGRWLLVWRKADENPFLVNGSRIGQDAGPLRPDHVGHFDDSDEVLLMYRLETHEEYNHATLHIQLQNIDNEGLAILQGWEEAPDDIIDIDKCLPQMQYKHNGRKISMKRAMQLLGAKPFWSGVSRANFHYSCCRTNPDDDTIKVEFRTTKFG